MKKFLIIIVYVYIITCPFYVFESGLPQPSDFIISIGCFGLFVSGQMSSLFKLKVIKRLFQFIGLSSIINIIYWLVYTSQGVENKFFLPILFYVFDSFVFCALVYVLNKNFEKVASHLALAIIISLSIQAILALAHIGTGRGSLYFNNPNQLGYYALTSLTVFACLPSVYRSNKLMTMAVLILSSYLILYSGSRAALLGVILLGSIIFVKEGFKVDASSIAFIILVIGAGWYFFNRNDFVDAQIKSIQDRQESKSSQGVSEFEVRGYDRFYLAPEYVLYGAGEGKYDRFHSYHSLEMHSGPGTILFSYGVLGFYLFFSFVAIVIKRDLFNNSLLIAPVILYNFTHQGFRESLFWILLACIFMVSSKQYVKDVFLKVRKHGHFEFLK